MFLNHGLIREFSSSLLYISISCDFSLPTNGVFAGKKPGGNIKMPTPSFMPEKHVAKY